MKENVMLTVASLLSVVLGTLKRDDACRVLHFGAHHGGLGVRNAGAGRAAIGLHHTYPRVTPWAGRPWGPHDGGGDRQVDRLLLRLDNDGARCVRELLPHPFSARTLAPATGQAR